MEEEKKREKKRQIHFGLYCLFIICVIFILMQKAFAIDFTVIDYNKVLYTNEYTKLLNNADINDVLVSKVDSNLPVQVIGITSNGYFKVVIANQVLYIPGDGLSESQNDTSMAISETSVNEILYTNNNTKLYQGSNNNSLLVSSTESDLPVQVVAITSNGYYKVIIANQTLYIPINGLSSSSTIQNINTTQISQESVYNLLMSQQSKFPNGLRFTNANYYGWNGGTYIGGYGCAAFAFCLSDFAFGTTPAKIHKDYSNIKVGDILRIYNNTHSVIVLKVKTNSVVVAEANYYSQVLWGRELSLSEIQDSQSYIMTRY
jgi:hypothetical protein